MLRSPFDVPLNTYLEINGGMSSSACLWNSTTTLVLASRSRTGTGAIHTFARGCSCTVTLPSYLHSRWWVKCMDSVLGRALRTRYNARLLCHHVINSPLEFRPPPSQSFKSFMDWEIISRSLDPPDAEPMGLSGCFKRLPCPHALLRPRLPFAISKRLHHLSLTPQPQPFEIHVSETFHEFEILGTIHTSRFMQPTLISREGSACPDNTMSRHIQMNPELTRAGGDLSSSAHH